MSSQWTPEAIRALGATTDLPTLGSILGVSRWKAYQMAQTGEWDQVGIRIVPIGAKYRVAVQSILKVLGQGGEGDPDTAHESSDNGQKQAAGKSRGQLDHGVVRPGDELGQTVSRPNSPAVPETKSYQSSPADRR